ncbi:MAG: thymidine phosphorylase, partial [Bacteroidota bacterium]
TKEDKIDPKAGIIFYPKIGDRIRKGEIIAELFTDKKSKIKEVKSRITGSLKFSSKPTSRPRLIKKILT